MSPDRTRAAPTLIKQLPLPLRRVIGDRSDAEKVLLGLEVFARTHARNRLRAIHDDRRDALLARGHPNEHEKLRLDFEQREQEGKLAFVLLQSSVSS